MHLNNRTCPFCNGDKLLRYSAPAHDSRSNQVHIIECRHCQAGWQWPLQRTEQDSITEFEQAYAAHVDGTYFDQNTREAVANCQFEFLKTRVSHPGRLLDVGCGDGHFARYIAHRGWDVVGLDPVLVEEIVEETADGRLSLRGYGIDELPIEQFFDVITLWDVIEHVEKPDQLIAQAAARLAPGGILIVETGNYQCAGRINSQGTWWNFQLDHRWYFAPPQLNALMTQVGLVQVELSDKVLRPWWKGDREMPSPRLMTLAKGIVKRPWKMFSTLRRHHDLSLATEQWAGWGGLEIMTMTGKRSLPPA